jgi:ribosomal protein S27AE
LANKYTQRLLLSEVNESGFIGTFDFLYLPIDTDTNANKGYAFINFSESSFAWMFKQAFEGRRMHMFNSDKVVSVSAAALQGFDNNYAHYVNARCNRGDPACRPLFLRAPSSTVATKPMARSGRRNGRGHGRSNLDRLAETQQLQQQLEVAVQALMTKQQQDQQQPQQQEDEQLQHATRFCPYCGNKAKVDFKFCPGCGSSLASLEAA